ncbi:MAG: hypothetical protein NPIRA02_02800 [Nitrospirales bacterium]|nr:MAG: hypothetical protein NPIRA02_02800 [Nitrospirales bacterium]
MSQDPRLPHEGTSLIADPIHGYITFTVPRTDGASHEYTEQDLIDSPWLQRLRYIYQLQSAHWVYPAAEHTRFQHSLGAMHLAGRFANHVYPTLSHMIHEVPSPPYIEALLRVAALLHDVGHGPFCHFFDHHFLNRFHLTHEHIGQVIIRTKLGPIIEQITRSPSGPFMPGERLNPDHVAFLILKDPHKSTHGYPRWLTALQPLLGGVYTADNCDYILRDSYMCGVAIGPVDIERLIHYTFFTNKGLTIHKSGLPALQMFLHARLYLYTNVYYHRTTRAIDLHLQEIFSDTMRYLYPHNPLEHLDTYLVLTDWHIIEAVRTWERGTHRVKKRLGREWARILMRDVKWKMAYTTLVSLPSNAKTRTHVQSSRLDDHIRQALPPRLRRMKFWIDMAHQDPRPINLLNMGGFQIFVYDPSTRHVAKESLQTFFEHLPARMVQFRIYTHDHKADAELAQAAKHVLGEKG